MKLKDRCIVITGAASGIGRALALRFAAEAPRAIVAADLPSAQAGLDSLVAELSAGGSGRSPVPAIAVAADVANEGDVIALVDAARDRFGTIDLFASNAGLIRDGNEHAPDAEWQLNWNVHVMAHVYAARAVLPDMLKRGEGYLLNTASAAGLLTSLPSATYAVSKHAAVAFAEYLAIQHGNAGIRVSVLCPQAVATPMIENREGSMAAAVDGVMAASELADCVVKGVDAESFLILPHPEVYEYFGRKGKDYERWLSGMRRFAAKHGFPTRPDGHG